MIARHYYSYFLLTIAFIITAQSCAELHTQGHTHWHNFIRHLLNQYERPITVLELGASRECISFDIVRHYRATCVMIDWDDPDSLLAQCKREESKNIILLGRSLTIENLKHLSECEHFDVVIVHDVITRFAPHEQMALYAIMNMGDYIVFKNLSSVYSSSVRQPLYNLGCCSLFMMRKKHLERTAWVKSRSTKNKFTIKSTFQDKYLYKGWKIRGTPWIRGINLYTYKATQALYPSFQYVYDQIKQFYGIAHNDIWIGNMVIQGKRVKLIDFDDKRRNADPKAHLDYCLHEFERAIRSES